MLISTVVVGQDQQSDQTQPKELERVIVFADDMAVVAVLDEDGLITKKIMEIPDYFEQNHSDEHYIRKSMSVLSDVAIQSALEKRKRPHNELATSESIEPDN